MARRCLDCAFSDYRPIPDEGPEPEELICRRHPPPWLAVDAEEDWCGEFVVDPADPGLKED